MTTVSSIVQPGPVAKTAPGQECCGPTGRARTSKIARLPADIRAELNERLLEAEPPAAILEWLNGLPEVQRVLAQSFDSQPITEVNLSRWRQGGYAGWLEQRNTQEAVEAVATAAAGVEGPAAENLNRHLAVVLSARLFVEMQRCGAMPDGPDKTASLHQLVVSVRPVAPSGVLWREGAARPGEAENAGGAPAARGGKKPQALARGTGGPHQ